MVGSLPEGKGRDVEDREAVALRRRGEIRDVFNAIQLLERNQHVSCRTVRKRNSELTRCVKPGDP